MCVCVCVQAVVSKPQIQRNVIIKFSNALEGCKLEYSQERMKDMTWISRTGMEEADFPSCAKLCPIVWERGKKLHWDFSGILF